MFRAKIFLSESTQNIYFLVCNHQIFWTDKAWIFPIDISGNCQRSYLKISWPWIIICRITFIMGIVLVQKGELKAHIGGKRLDSISRRVGGTSFSDELVHHMRVWCFTEIVFSNCQSGSRHNFFHCTLFVIIYFMPAWRFSVQLLHHIDSNLKSILV